MRLAERVVKRAVNIDDKPLTIDDILEKVCNHFNVSVSGVNGKSRKRELVIARQVSMYLAQKYTKMPASRIGKLVGGRDHSTVIHSCSQIEQRMKIEKGFAEEVNSIENSFKLKA
jgi:chromosomal replication initiator protein